MLVENMQCWKMSRNAGYKHLLIQGINMSTNHSAEFRLTRINGPTYRAPTGQPHRGSWGWRQAQLNRPTVTPLGFSTVLNMQLIFNDQDN